MKRKGRWEGTLEYGTLYAMRRHKASQGGSNAQQSCVPATALEQSTKNRAKRSKIVEHLIKKRAKHQPETWPKIDGKSTKNRTKINPKSTKNPPKIDPKSNNIQSKSKNVAHFVLGAVLEASWRRLGRILEANIAPSWPPKSKENQ